jgi:hypothetical protein
MAAQMNDMGFSQHRGGREVVGHFARDGVACRNVFFLIFPYVCIEPVLVKRLFLGLV